MKMNIEAKNQLQTIPAGPAGIEYARVLAIDGNRPMMLNAMPKTSIIVKLRFNLFPKLSAQLVTKRWKYTLLLVAKSGWLL